MFLREKKLSKLFIQCLIDFCSERQHDVHNKVNFNKKFEAANIKKIYFLQIIFNFNFTYICVESTKSQKTRNDANSAIEWGWWTTGKNLQY